jgi:nucleoside-diphosphate-sugar epimerase
MIRPIDDSKARKEWGWKPTYDLERIIDAFLADLRITP